LPLEKYQAISPCASDLAQQHFQKSRVGFVSYVIGRAPANIVCIALSLQHRHLGVIDKINYP
jgi:hypothetical protein